MSSITSIKFSVTTTEISFKQDSWSSSNQNNLDFALVDLRFNADLRIGHDHRQGDKYDFVDLTKAYNNIPGIQLFYRLEKSAINMTIQKLYTDAYFKFNPNQ